MARDTHGRRDACLAKARAELDGLADAGVVMAGNAFPAVLLVKGELSATERARASALLGGVDGDALRAALSALGYAPTDWCALSALADDGETPLSPGLLRKAFAVIDPTTAIACDETAARLVREAFADELASLEELPAAALEPGFVAHVLGMRLMNLGGFADALGDPREKQLMWACLKRLAPLGEPY